MTTPPSTDLLAQRRLARRPALDALASGDFEAAEQHFRAAWESDPGWARHGVAIIEERRGNLEAAEALHREAVACSPEIARYRHDLYTVLRRLQRNAAASEVVATALQALSSSAEIHELAVADLLANGQKEAAMVALKRALDLFPDTPSLEAMAVAPEQSLAPPISEASPIAPMPETPERKNHRQVLLDQAQSNFFQGTVREICARLLAHVGVLPIDIDGIHQSAGEAPNRKDIISEIISGLITDSHIRLPKGLFEFISKTDLSILINEIFVHEDYFFRSESKTPFILDCGSNIGLSVYYFKELYPDCELVAFEPGRRAFEVLERNVKAMELRNVTLHRVALSDTDGEQTLFDPDTMPMGASLTGRLPPERYAGHSYTVQTRRLSTFIDRPVDFLKLDIEGVEADVLEEIKEKLSLVRMLFCEIHYDRRGPKSADRLLRILAVLDHQGFDTVVLPSALNRQNDYRNGLRASDYSSLNLWARNRSPVTEPSGETRTPPPQP